MGGVDASQVITVRVGDVELEVEAVPVAGTEDTWAGPGKAAGNALEAFRRAQDAIIEIAKSTAEMIDKAGVAVRPDRVDVEFGLKFSASGGVILAGASGEASLTVTLGYDVAARRAAPESGALNNEAATPVTVAEFDGAPPESA